jgi:putative membrane protein
LILNVGGMWVLYTTDLYMMMQQHLFLHVLIHLHVFLAGYLFTISVIYIDPTPHRTSFVYRSVILLIALAAHGILSKYIYSHPPYGVSISQAEKGGMIMYYGGDAIELILIFILCFQWYKSSRPRLLLENTNSLNKEII